MGEEEMADSREQSPNRSESTGHSLLTEGIVLAFITLAGYAIAFMYEVGYLSHFGIPSSVAEISTSQILRTCFIVALLLYAAVILLDHAAFAISVLPARAQRPVLFASTPLILALFLFFNEAWLFAWVMLAFAVVAALFEFCCPPPTGTPVARARSSIVHLQDETGKARPFHISDLVDRVPTAVLLLTLFFVVSSVASFAIGWAEASMKDYYWYDPEREDEAIVRVYYSRVVGCRADSGMVVTGRFFIRDISPALSLAKARLVEPQPSTSNGK